MEDSTSSTPKEQHDYHANAGCMSYQRLNHKLYSDNQEHRESLDTVGTTGVSISDAHLVTSSHNIRRPSEYLHLTCESV